MKRKRGHGDHGERKGLRGVRYFVLDEADRMLDMGFMPQVREILQLLGGGKRQSLLFSATWPPAVHDLAREVLSEAPARISIDQRKGEELSANTSVVQQVEVIRERDKEARLLELLKEHGSAGKTLIFVNTKKGCAALAAKLRMAGVVPCAEIHGNLTQVERAGALAEFTAGTARTLVATDVAARGLDVEDITLVVCFDFPDSMTGGMEDYVHRIGRTGRAGRTGWAVTFFPAPADVSGTRSAGNAHDLIKLLQAAGQEVSPDLAKLDQGPVVSSVNQRSGKGGKKGFKGSKGTKSGRGATAVTEATGPPNDRGVRIEGVEGDVQPVTRFQDSPFRKALRKELLAAGYTEPTPIQAYAWPLLLSGRDCIAIAKTGSGKTLAFLLPALHSIHAWLQEEQTSAGTSDASGVGPLALVVAPTRELAAQIHREAERFTRGCRAGCVHGGTPWEPQAALLEAGVELLVATPGRLAFLMARGGEAAATAARAIASCGARKQLTEAVAVFDRFVSENGNPSRHLFSSFLNVHVLCGDLQGAVQVAEKMQQHGLPLGVVEYTTLLKGHLNAGDVDAAKSLLEKMGQASPPICPDIRAANTFLRGCLKLGALPDADEFYARLPVWAVEPDAATVKIWGQLLAQGLRLKPLQRLWRETEGKESSLEQLDNAAGLNCAIAQVACLLGARKAAEKALERARSALSTELTAQAEFDRLRRQELQREVAFLKKAMKAGPFDLPGALGRLLAAPPLRCGPAPNAKAALEALRRGFGLPQCFERGLCAEEDFQAQLSRCLRGGRLRWRRLFTGSQVPTLLEVCSGTGDWVVAQAQADAGRANWVASELRYDRAWSILTKAIFANVENLAVVAGDAGTVLREWVPPGSVAKVCVNFPEPPQTTRNANCDEAESELHLLTSDFFEDVHKALCNSGVLTIFSDNEEYMRSLARTLGLLRKGAVRLFEASADVEASHLEDAEEMCGLLICRGCPGEAEGHVAKASSQFDRFFQHGQHTDRFYISVVKVASQE